MTPIMRKNQLASGRDHTSCSITKRTPRGEAACTKSASISVTWLQTSSAPSYSGTTSAPRTCKRKSSRIRRRATVRELTLGNFATTTRVTSQAQAAAKASRARELGMPRNEEGMSREKAQAMPSPSSTAAELARPM